MKLNWKSSLGSIAIGLLLGGGAALLLHEEAKADPDPCPCKSAWYAVLDETCPSGLREQREQRDQLCTPNSCSPEQGNCIEF